MTITIDCAREIELLSELARECREILRELGERAPRPIVAVSAWSVEQHCYHLALSADLAFANVQALLGGTSARIVHVGQPNELAREVFAAGGYPRGRSQAPRTVWPPEQPERVLLELELERIASSLAALAPEGPAIAGAGGRIPHRQLGALSAAEWLHFARLHTAHHVEIVRELRRAILTQST